MHHAIVRSATLIATLLLTAASGAGAPPTQARDFIRTRTAWSGQYEFWMVSNTSTDRPIRVTLRYQQICTGPATISTETITLEPGVERRVQQKNQYMGCGDKYLTIAGAYFP